MNKSDITKNANKFDKLYKKFRKINPRERNSLENIILHMLREKMHFQSINEAITAIQEEVFDILVNMSNEIKDK